MNTQYMKRLQGFSCRPIIMLCLLALLVPLATGEAQAPEESILYQEDFTTGDARGWSLEQGWGIIAEGDNPVLVGEGHAWARPPETENYPGDFRVRFRLKLVRGSIHMVYRMNNSGRYYIGFDANGSYFHKQYWPDTFIDLLRLSFSHSLDTWHDIEIVGTGDRIQFYADGRLELEYTDPEPLLYGTFAFETLDDGLAYIDDIVVYGPAPAAGSAPTGLTWVRTGGPLGGLGYDIRMRPDNPDIMYVTDAWAGVFMSTDGGANWEPSNNGITTRTGESGDAIPVFCLTIDPHDPDTIWVGTQNVRGIFKSVDGGQTWAEMDNGVQEREGITFRGFTVDPRSSDIVYAAAELSSWVWAGQPRPGREFDMTGGVVYRTTDGGQNWSAIWRGDNLARYVWIDPRDPDVIYISTGIFDREAANSDPAAGTPGGEGVVRSTDGGQTWQQFNNGLNNLYVGTLFMHPENPDVLLAGTGNNQYFVQNGVYLTTDGGETWQQTLRDDNINAVEFSSANPNIAYAGSAAAIYRSEDGGVHWQRMSHEDGWGPSGVRAGFPIDFQVDPRNADRLFANNYGGGNFVSEDGGATWQVASAGYTGAQVRAIAVDPGSPDRVFAAARSGFFASEDSGTTWIGLNTIPANTLEWNAVAVDPADPRHVLAANNWNGQILESANGGGSWRIASPGAGEGKGWRAIAFAPADSRVVYSGMSAFYSAGGFDDMMAAGGIYVSVDGGASWSGANDAGSKEANVIALAVQPDDPQVVYAATGNMGLLKTTDGGHNWTALAVAGGGMRGVLSVAVHPQEPNVVFAGLVFGGLQRSSDGGQTWQLAGAGLAPEANISSIVIDPTNPEVMYTSDRFSGVFRSLDGGQTWQVINEGLLLRHVNALALTTDGRHLYAATEGGGVFRLDLEPGSP